MSTKPTKENLDQRIHDHKLEPLPNRIHEITRGVIRQKEERYRDILESMEEGYFELDLKGTFTFVNNAACTLMGYEYDELIGMNYKTYTTPETTLHMYEVFHRIFETGKRETMVDYEVICKNGSVRIHEMNASLLRDMSGQPMGFRVMVWDLTESKREEDILRKREERYRNILESMAEAYFEVDLKGNLTFFNSTATKGLGYTNEEMMGMNFHQFVDDENARKVFDAFHKVFLTGETIKAFEWEFINKHGEKIAVESSVSLRRDENSSLTGFRGVVRDISDQKKAEAAQLESEEKYRSILENIEEGYYEVALNGNFTFFNDSLCRMIGYSREEMMGMNYGQFMDKEYKLKVYNIFHNVFLTGKSDMGFDWEIVGNDGSRRQIESSIVLIRNSNGKPVGFRGIVHDITDRKRVEEALKESEERYRILAENARDVIWVFDLNLGYTYVSPSIKQLRGYTVEEALKQSLDQVLTPESFKFAKELFDREFSLELRGLYHGPEWSYTTELEMICKDGSTVWTEVTMNILYDENDKPKGFMGITRDITERKRMYKELQKSQQIMRLVLDTIPVGVFWKDRDSKYLGCNRQFAIYADLGSGEEIIGKYDRDMPWAEDSELYIKNDRKVIESGMPIYNFEHLERKTNGNSAWLSTSKVPLYDADGRINGLLGTFDDITVRKQAEEAIRKSEERYRTIFESTATANIITAEDTTILLANTNFANLVGYSKQELEGKISWTVFVENEDLKKVKNYHMMRRINPGSAPSSYEFRYINRKGEVRDLFMSVALIPETKDSVASMIDITEWKRSEQARKNSEARFRELAELLPETVYETDGNGVFTFVNKTGLDKFGCPQEDLFRKMSVFDMIIPGDHTRMIATYKRLIKGERVGLGEYTARKKDGSTFPALVYATAIFRDGKPMGHRGFMIDISEKKSLEKQLTRAQKMEAIGILAGGVAHDLNNVLSGIVSYPDLLLMQLPGNSPLRAPIETIKQTGQKAAAIVMDLLTLARRGVTTTEIVNLNDIIQEYLKSPEYMKLISFHDKVKVESNLSKDLMNIQGSPFHMTKTIMNLISNAAEAMPNGGTLFISTENRYIDKPINGYDQIEEGEYVALSITDSGVGISLADRERIFEPFYTKKVMGRSGTGLGMAVVWGTVKDHNGHIDLKSYVGKGTTFTLFFPVTREELISKKASLSIDEYMGRGESILVVDDAREQREIASAILTELGYSVMTISSGEAAVEYLKDHSVELIVLDMIMDPGIDGLETYKLIHKDHSGQKAIITSGFSETDRVKEALDLGVGTYIKKPYTLEVLGVAVRRELERV